MIFHRSGGEGVFVSESGEPMDAAEKSAEAAGEEQVHEKEAALVLNEGNLHFGIGNGGSPGVLADFAQGEGT